MNFNRKALSQLMSLNDEQLAAALKGIAAEAGVDPSTISLTPSDIASIRAAISALGSDDVARLLGQLGNGGK